MSIVATPSRLRVQVGYDDGAVQKGTAETEARLKGMAESGKSHLSAVSVMAGTLGAQAVMAVGSRAMSLVGDSIGAASDMGETVSKTGVIFGDASDQILKWSETSADRLGQSRQQALDAASTFATFGKSAGLAGDDLAGFATGLTGLATDLGSFHNATPEETIEAIGAALRGEAEPMRRFGVLLDDATLRQKAFEMGLISSTKNALEPSQKVLAAQAVIMDQTKDAQGDFERTSGSLANQQRELAANFADVKTKLGEAFLPIVTKVVTFLNETGVPVFMEMVGGVKAFAAAFKAGDGDITSAGFPGFMERVGFITRQVFDWLKLQWPTIKDIFLAAFDGAKQAWTNVLQPVLATIIEVARVVILWIQENWPAIQAAFTEVFNQVKSVFDAVVIPLFQGIVAVAQFVVSWIKDNWPGIQETFQGVFDTIRNAWQSNFAPVLEAIVEVANNVRDWFQENWPTIQKVIGVVFDGIKYVVDNGLLPALNLMIDISGTAVSAVIWTFREVLWPAIDWVFGSIQWAWDTVLKPTFNAIKELADTVSSAFGRLREAGDKVSNLASSFYSFGRDAIQGLIDGIWSKFQGAIDAVKDVGEGITGAFKSVLRIGSPSKVFQEFGQYVVDGFRIGTQGLSDVLPELALPEMPSLSPRATSSPLGGSPGLLLPTGAGGPVQTINLTVNPPPGTDARALVDALKAWSESNGPLPFATAA